MLSLSLFIILLGVGVIAGFLAGLLGVGGGLIVVPVVTGVLGAAHLGGEHVQHLALGTSLAVMVFTNLSSVYAHHKRKAVNWQLVRNMAPSMVIGTFVGSAIAGQLSSSVLKWFFMAFVYTMGLQMLRESQSNKVSQRSLPGQPVQWGIGTFIGVISSWVGIGGGSMTIPFLVKCQVPVRTAIATSAALGWPIAVSGTIGYIINGLNTQHLPLGSLGYIYLPAAISLLLMTVLFAPIGAKVAHRVSVNKLKKFFAVLLLLIATQMLYELLRPYWY